jgi:Skp family chaperone for outer membrane proteins
MENLMNNVLRIVLAFTVSAIFLAGCDQMSGGSDVAVIDLGAVASATGQDEMMREQAEAGRNELSLQLQQLVQGLDQQLVAETEKAGDNPTPEQQQFLQQLNMQARQRITEAQTQAQGQIGQLEQTLVADFRASISPLAEEIAQANGASVILADDSYMFWFDSSVDITDEVIAAWRALPKEAATSEVQEELAEVESELAEVEEQLEELQETVERSAPAE